MAADTPREMLRDQIVKRMTEARRHTLFLVAPLTEEDLRTQHDPIMGPILWDLGHIAAFEELWLLRNLNDVATFGEVRGMYNPFEHPRATRGGLALPSRAECLDFMADVRRRVLAMLDRIDFAADVPLLREGFVFRMVLQHEYQHGETILQTLQLKRGEPYAAPGRLPLPSVRHGIEPGAMVHFPGGEVSIGTDDRSAAYDNERPRHAVRLEPFWIDVAPVTNGAYLEFMAAGGYDRREYWSDAGWAWLADVEVRAPKYWHRNGNGEWHVRSMDSSEPVDPARPVCHVCYHEAEAFARFAGKRLPSEVEWEAAASWDPVCGEARLYPWGGQPPARHRGHTAVPGDALDSCANLDQLSFGTAPIGAYPRNLSPVGCYGMIGDVWEWTSSDFRPYPGYETFPYREYSEVFFGRDYKVLRGGSWATRAGAIRNTFRNWDYPVRRQLFSGFRCARDA